MVLYRRHLGCAALCRAVIILREDPAIILADGFRNGPHDPVGDVAFSDNLRYGHLGNAEPGGDVFLINLMLFELLFYGFRFHGAASL